MTEYSTIWPLRAAIQITRERFLAEGGVVLVAPGDRVEPDQIVARGEGPPALAGVRGQVVRVEAERGAVIQGVATVAAALWGIGAVVAAPLVALSPGATRPMGAYPPGAILIVPGELTPTIWRAALEARAGGIMAASARPDWLEDALGAPLTALVDGSRSLTPPLSLALTQGFTPRPPPVEFWQALRERDGEWGLLCPATDLQGAARPTLAISLPRSAAATVSLPDPRILPGVTVWIGGGEYDGATGQVVALLGQSVPFASGTRAVAARVTLTSGAAINVPIANLTRAG